MLRRLLPVLDLVTGIACAGFAGGEMDVVEGL